MFNLKLKNLNEAKALEDALESFCDIMKDHGDEDKQTKATVFHVKNILNRLQQGENNIELLNAALER